MRTLANMAERLGDQFAFRIITRDRDAGDAAAYPGCCPGTWQSVGQADVMYLSSKLCAFHAMRRIINQTEHDVLYLNSFFTPVFTIQPLVLRRLGLIRNSPVILAPRGEFSPGALQIRKQKKLAYIRLAQMLGIYHNVIWQASSDLEKCDIHRWFGNTARVHLAPNLGTGLDESTTLTTRRKGPGHLSIAFLSRVCRKKNVDGALRLLAKLRGQVTFDIFGPRKDLAYWNECQHLISQMPPNVKVEARGPIPHHQVLEVLQQYHLFLFPTHGENFGHVILESLLAGCPVLLSDQTPWRGLADKGVGWDLSLDAPEQIRHVLQYCIDMGDEEFQEMSQRAREYGRSVVEAPETVERNRALFHDTISRGRLVA